MKDITTLKQMIVHLLFVLNKKQKRQMVGMFFIILVGSMFELLGVSAMLPFVQSILAPDKLMQKTYIRFFCALFDITDPNAVIIMVGIGIIMIYLLKNIYLTISNYLQASYSNQTKKELAIRMLRSYMERSYAFFIDQGTGKINQGVEADTDGVYKVVNTLFHLASELLVIISVAMYLIATDWIMATGVLTVGFLCVLLIVFGMKKKITKMSFFYRGALTRQHKSLYQITGGIKDIMVYCRHKFFLKKYEDSYEDTCKVSTYYTFISGLPERVIEAFCIMGILLTVLIRLQMKVDVGTFIPNMAVFAMGAFRILPSISRSAGYINNLVYSRPFAEGAYENMKEAQLFKEEMDNRMKSLQSIDEVEDTEFDFRSEIKVKNITWKYKEGKDDVLKDLFLDVHKGEAVGIIGASGAGKSTLGDILLRLYHPQKGEILMDGINIDAIPLTWSHVIGYVPQSVFLVDDTVRTNVVFGADNPSDEKVWEALRKASLDQFVKQLPKGLDTIVGERGVKFSGGQRQRVAIARALYADPQILILDEATSALDNETEDAVMEAIDALAGSMTLIIIAHRVTTLKSCDKIYEIVDGKAVERDKNDVIVIS